MSRRLPTHGRLPIWLVSLCLAGWASPALPQQPQQESIVVQLDACNLANPNAADARIKACTAVINSGVASDRGVAIAYNNRALAYILKQQYDLAIADATTAIQKSPD